ncbi:MAG: ferredoxin [Chloroflexus sp.]|jgi:chlorosome envelope protein I|uniref:Ferredoxin n=1 Tax=Chloroflexus aurantiacus (strain ATCC 29366 / DSM 635 / J-10-fl) TaxID=324602 RepID=A9WDK1_CHLAA|nr:MULTISPECIES: 2Fe-2S iron-sulfur cluster-binding protein [Chloroflexus]ABY33607.1 ferredoxin [Chloroflexus aurantiacus J-10-fl]RMG52565.1 MAG: (2Fe-2S)-binding protein [Chloroflexota bacterium]GIV87402.1 MAG: ferredoxin [Chloroflexus sp.]HBW67232.1 ferredoxin [Chloroflexus aurantiacus]
MATVIVNDVEMTARPGERILDIARRNSAHIGFVCDGTGFCQTCKVRVLAGAEFLSPPNDREKNWLPDARLQEGWRLGCQASVRGKGPIAVITNAEELRLQAFAAINPPAGSSVATNVSSLITNLTQQSIDQLVGYPWNMLNAIATIGLGRIINPWQSMERFSQWLTDIGKVVEQTLNSPAPAPPSDPLARVRAAAAEVRRASE